MPAFRMLEFGRPASVPYVNTLAQGSSDRYEAEPSAGKHRRAAKSRPSSLPKDITMLKPNVLFLTLAAWSALIMPVDAQETNLWPILPATRLEAFETNVGAITIKGTTDLGSVSAASGVVSVKAKEFTDTRTGRKEHGIAVEISRGGQYRDALLIDDDELGSLLTAIDYLSKLDVSVSPLNAFDAAYTTKGGFRIAALGARRTGLVQFGVRDARVGDAPVPLSRQEMTQLWSLIDQANKLLVGLR